MKGRHVVLVAALAALAACADDVVGIAETPAPPAPHDDGGAGPDANIDADAPFALEDGELRPGGATTTQNIGQGAFTHAAANLPLARRNEFEAGLQFFQLPWEPAPGRVDTDGLGPTFNASTCLACHVSNGRGTRASVLLRIGLGPTNAPDPVYGSQLQDVGIPGVPAEGRPVRTESPVMHGAVELLDVSYAIASPGFGPFGADLRISPRIAPHLVGQGLLEAIPEADILAGADPDDANGDGISGRARLVNGLLGRFGWKAGQPTVETQTAAAFAEDLGITTPLFPDANCPPAQTACVAARNGGSPELSGPRLTVTAAHVRLLSVPVRRNGEAVLPGKKLFGQIGCASCHRPSFVTAPVAIEPELVNQKIWPYTDLLVHDLGESLSDHRTEGDAGEREWRTPPLWALGLVPIVNGELHLLHDGRARTFEEAILWHGGEADRARLGYEALGPADRAALHAFLESL